MNAPRTCAVRLGVFRMPLYFALYGCETWSFTLREEHRLMVLKKTVLRRTLDRSSRKTEEVATSRLEESAYCRAS